MNKKDFETANISIENGIRRKIEEESIHSEMFVIKIFRILVPVFSLIPLGYLFYDYFYKKEINIFYWVLFIYLIAVIIYHHFVSRLLRNGIESYFIKFINVTLEISTISFVIVVFYRVFSATVILSGPLIMVYMIMILMTGFRYSFRISFFSGIMAAFQFLIIDLAIIHEVPLYLYERLIDFGPAGLFQKCLYLILCGFVSGYLALNAKSLIRKTAVKTFETNHIKSTFGQYVSREIRDYILSGEVELGGEEKYGVILFSDIRNFNDVLYKKDPKLVISRLNEYFTEMVKIIAENQGVVNKFVGDAIMAVFGLVDYIHRSEYLAVKSAVEMQDKLDELNARWEAENGFSFEMGIGISSGSFLTGNIGCEDRKEFTCIGDVVNIASRLEHLTRLYNQKIIVSSEVKNQIRNDDCGFFGYIGDIDLKGKMNKVKVYYVKIDDFKSPRDAFLEELTGTE